MTAVSFQQRMQVCSPYAFQQRHINKGDAFKKRDLKIYLNPCHSEPAQSGGEEPF
jgi:hypothetical protein